MIRYKTDEYASSRRVVNEMAKAGHVSDFDLWMHPKVYENERPHVHVCIANTSKSVAKLQLSEARPSAVKDIVFLDDTEKAVNSSLKNELVSWANASNKYGVNNWDKCLSYWEDMRSQFEIDELKPMPT